MTKHKKKSAQEVVDPTAVWEQYVPIVTTAKPDGGYQSIIHITNEIAEPSKYTECITVLNNAQEDDIIVFNINCPGGRLDTVLMLIDALYHTKASTVSRVTGEAASGATMLMLATDNLEVSEYGSAMIHYYSGGLYGKGNELKSRMEFEVRHLPRIFHGYYKHFLSKKECRTVIKGDDMYMAKEEILERWANVEKHRDIEDAKDIAEAEQQGIDEVVTFLETMGYDIKAP